MQGPHHHPRISRRSDGRWVVRCPQCEEQPFDAIPIGIAMPLESLRMTELILANHVTRQGPESRRKIA
jgi:hypothetical protein